MNINDMKEFPLICKKCGTKYMEGAYEVGERCPSFAGMTDETEFDCDGVIERRKLDEH